MSERDHTPKLRFELRQGLTGSAYDAALDLVQRACAAEGLELYAPLNAGMADQLLCLEGPELVALAWLQDGPEIEVSGVVAPERRREGIGSALLAAVRDECARRQAGLLMSIDEASPSGHGFITAHGGRLHHSEHLLELDSTTIDRSRAAPAGLSIREADSADYETLVFLQATSFDDDEAEARGYITAGLNDPTRQYLIGELDGTPVGLLRIGRYQDFADVTAFGVLRDYRGRGIGRAMLLYAVDLLLSENWGRILIEVFTDNENALGLYESCGFRVQRTYGFYEF